MKVELSISSSDAGSIAFESNDKAAAFVILAHLPGFKKDEIRVAINEDGKEVCVRGSGGSRSKERVAISRRLEIVRKASIRRFQKVFEVPEGVVSGRMEAVFDEDDGVLLVLMPKSSGGDESGIQIDEGDGSRDYEGEPETGTPVSVKEDEESAKGQPTTPTEPPANVIEIGKEYQRKNKEKDAEEEIPSQANEREGGLPEIGMETELVMVEADFTPVQPSTPADRDPNLAVLDEEPEFQTPGIEEEKHGQVEGEKEDLSLEQPTTATDPPPETINEKEISQTEKNGEQEKTESNKLYPIPAPKEPTEAPKHEPELRPTETEARIEDSAGSQPETTTKTPANKPVIQSPQGEKQDREIRDLEAEAQAPSASKEEEKGKIGPRKVSESSLNSQGFSDREKQDVEPPSPDPIERAAEHGESPADPAVEGKQAYGGAGGGIPASDDSDDGEEREIGDGEDGGGGERGRRRRRVTEKLNFPLHPSVLAGSAFILSLMWLVIHLLRRQGRYRRNPRPAQ